MSDIVLKTLRRELKKKTDRIERLEVLLSESHLCSATAKAMDGFARRFNNAATAKERSKSLMSGKRRVTCGRSNTQRQKIKTRTL